MDLSHIILTYKMYFMWIYTSMNYYFNKNIEENVVFLHTFFEYWIPLQQDIIFDEICVCLISVPFSNIRAIYISRVHLMWFLIIELIKGYTLHFGPHWILFCFVFLLQNWVWSGHPKLNDFDTFSLHFPLNNMHDIANDENNRLLRGLSVLF